MEIPGVPSTRPTKPTMDAYLEHADWVRKLARELVRDPGTAEDLIQETWLAFEKAKPDAERSLRPWLSRVMRNAAAMHRRRTAGRAAREEATATPERVGSTSDIVARAEEQRRLAGLVLTLAEPYRSTLLLRFYEGFSIAQIAKVQAIPAATVRTHLRRGLERLRQRLDAEYGGDRRAWVLLLKPLSLAKSTWSLSSILVGSAVVVLSMASAWWWISPQHKHANPTDELLEANRSEAEASVLQAPLLGSTSRTLPGRQSLAPPTERTFSLLSASTSEPMPFYWVRVAGDVWESDEHGQITLPGDVTALDPLNMLGLSTEVFDPHGHSTVQPFTYPSLVLPGDPGTETLQVPSGPTFAFNAGWPSTPSPATFEARLAIDGKENQGWVTPLQPPRPGFEWPWVRFAQVPPTPATQGAPWQLQVRDYQGFWSGKTLLETGLDSKDPLVAVDLQACGVLEGQVLGPLGVGLGQVTVLVITVDPALIGTLETPKTPRTWHQVKTDASGRFRIRWLPPGDYQTMVELESYEVLVRSTTLGAGQVQNMEMQLTPTLSAGRVAGSVNSQSGRYSEQLLIFLLDAHDSVLGVHPTQWERSSSGANEAHFEFRDVPAGRLHLQAISLADFRTFLVQPQEFEAPFENAQVTILDTVRTTAGSIEVLDAATLAPITDFHLEFGLRGRMRATLVHTAGLSAGEDGSPSSERWTQWAGKMRWNTWEGPRLRGLPTDSEFTWTLRAPGYAEQSGTQADLEPTLEGQPKLRRLLHRR